MTVKAALQITTGLRKGNTFLKSVYHTQPFKIMDVTEDKQQAQLELMLMMASPGILEGDEYKLQIELAANTSLQLRTQSYQRLFAMQGGASQHLCVQMEEGAHFCFLPHPVVPHKASTFTAHNQLYLQKNCTLIWGEVLTCGRKGCGEVFQFSKYSSKTEVYLHGKLVVKENLLLQPSHISLEAIGQLEGYTHQATFIYINAAADIEKLREKMGFLFKNREDVIFGISLLHVKGFIIRLLGNKGEQLYNMLHQVAQHLPAHPGLHKKIANTPVNHPAYDA